ncbi:MAG TPA: hypothetical protein VK736_12480 [Candidatus Binatia bacterium]|nr:hypothetical protein [Candidatus Binatia bacterium]
MLPATTHERFLQLVRDAVIAHAEAAGTITAEQAERARHAKLLYGVGNGSYRGICHYNTWENGVGTVDVVEVAATAQESWIQLAGTTLHELAHVIAGWNAGHGAAWKDAAVALGFKLRPEAAGQIYRLAMFAPQLRHAVYALAGEIGDGHPAFARFGAGPGMFVIPKPCSAGYGTKGGTSRGKGSGSRQRLWECECERPVKVRTASDDFKAHCDVCGSAFARAGVA